MSYAVQLRMRASVCVCLGEVCEREDGVCACEGACIGACERKKK